MNKSDSSLINRVRECSLVFDARLRVIVPYFRQSEIVKLAMIFGVLMLLFAQWGDRTVFSDDNWPRWFVHYATDALLVQLLTASMAVLVVLIYISDVRRLNFSAALLSSRLVVGSCGLVAATLLIAYLSEVVLLKPAFDYERPGSFEGDSFLVGRFRELVGGDGGASPSGFVVRQVWLILLSFAFLVRERSASAPCIGGYKYDKRRMQNLIIYGIAMLSVVCVFNRLATHAHSLFDVGMGFGAGLYSFVLFFYFMARLAHKSDEAADGVLFAISSMYLPIFLYFSRDASDWGVAIVVIFACLGLLGRSKAISR